MKIFKAIAITIGLTTSLSCFAQGGGSVNGPDLKGNMIPVYSDGEIPVEKLNVALDVCYKRTFEEIAGAVFSKTIVLEKTNLQNYKTDLGTVTPWQSPAPIPSNEKTPWGVGGSYGAEGIPGDLYAYLSYPTGCENKTNWEMCSNQGEDLTFNFTLKGQTIITKGYKIPFISYELKDKSTYGELGEIIDKKVFVSNVHYNFEPGNKNTVFTLYSERSDGKTVPTPLKLDILDLIQCVKTKLTN